MRLGPFVGRILLAVGVLLALYGLGWSLLRASTVLQVVAVSAAGAYLINPAVRRLQSRGMGRSTAIAAVFLGSFTLLAVSLYLLVPVAERQVRQVGEQMQGVMATSQVQVGRLQAMLDQRLPAGLVGSYDLQGVLDARVASLSRRVREGLTEVLAGIAANLMYVVLFPLFTFLLLHDGPRLYHRLLGALPNRYFEVCQRLFTRIDDQLGGYMRGVLVVTFCVAAVSTLGLWICGMRYFFVVGPLMGLLNIIPIFGPLVGMGIAAVAMLLQTGELVSVVGPVLVGVFSQVLDNVAFTPIAVSRSVHLHPLLVLVTTMAGGELLGLAGLLLAVPVTATVKVVWQAVEEARQSRRLTVQP
ncbi:MAG: AI-2E family transporter [Candidatus Latescibacterota bacterium]